MICPVLLLAVGVVPLATGKPIHCSSSRAKVVWGAEGFRDTGERMGLKIVGSPTGHSMLFLLPINELQNTVEP